MTQFKKVKIIGILLILIILVFSSCEAEKVLLYETLVLDVSNDESGASIKVENTIWGQDSFVKKDMSPKTLLLNNVQYHGTYQESYTGIRMSYETDTYKDEEKNITFSLRSDNGELVSISLLNKEFFNTEPYLEDVENPQENANVFSENIAKQYLTDFDSYTRIEEEPEVRTKEDDGKTYSMAYHRITYIRKIDGFYTSDYIRVTVTSKGNLVSIVMGDIHAFDNNTDLKVDEERLQGSVQTKVEEIYSTSKYQYINYEIERQIIAKTPEGQFVVQSLIDVILKDDMGEFKTAIALITAISE